MSFFDTKITDTPTPADASARRARGNAFRAALALRGGLTDAEIQEEEARLISEATAAAIAAGISTTGLGDGWSRTTINLEHIK